MCLFFRNPDNQLYIPLSSDKTTSWQNVKTAVVNFISHLVQIKLDDGEEYISFVELYIPLSSDKTHIAYYTRKVAEHFISHLVQIKPRYVDLLERVGELYIPLSSDKTQLHIPNNQFSLITLYPT